MNKSILELVHETADGLHKAGVMDTKTKTMREFDVLCLPSVTVSVLCVDSPMHANRLHHTTEHQQGIQG